MISDEKQKTYPEHARAKRFPRLTRSAGAPPERIRLLLLGLVVLSLFVAATADAHKVDRKRGFYLGATMMGSSLDAEDATPRDFTINEDGGGFELRAGYLFNPKFSLELSMAAYGLGYDVKDEDNIPTVAGGGLSFGAGFEYFVSDHFAFGMDLTHHIINYSEIEEDLGNGLIQKHEIDEKGTMTTLGLGATVYF